MQGLSEGLIAIYSAHMELLEACIEAVISSLGIS